MRKLTQENFISRCIATHNGKFSYETTVYKNRRSLIKIICPTHGEFEQLAESHIFGKGCDRCGKTFTGDTASWVAKAQNVHGDTYSYSKSVYITNKVKLTITCKTHGDFLQTPDNHVTNNQGCPSCTEYGFRDKKPGTLYILKDGNRIKVGITNHTAGSRAKNINAASGLSFEPTFAVRFERGKITRDIETLLLQYLRKTYKSDYLIYNGYTEVFLNVDENLLISKVIKVCGEVFAMQTNNGNTATNNF